MSAFSDLTERCLQALETSDPQLFATPRSSRDPETHEEIPFRLAQGVGRKGVAPAC